MNHKSQDEMVESETRDIWVESESPVTMAESRLSNRHCEKAFSTKTQKVSFSVSKCVYIDSIGSLILMDEQLICMGSRLPFLFVQDPIKFDVILSFNGPFL